MKILLLGATGLLGHNVLRLLLERGYSVVALVRDRARIVLPDVVRDTPQLTIVTGSLLDEGDLRHAASGCDAIVNCAGTTDMSLLRYADYLPVNRQLVENLLEIIDEKDMAAFVHVSTANTVGFGTCSRLADEEAPMEPPFTQSFYAQSKREGESLILKAAEAHPERHMIILNPGFMMGPFDTHPSSGQLLLSAYKHRWMAAPKGGKSFVHVADVATAVVNALTKGRNGERYLLTGENRSLKDFFLLQAEVCGYRQRVFSLPNWLVLLAGRLGDLLRWIHIPTQLATRNVRQLMVMEHYDCGKARKELDYPQTPVAAAIDDFFHWYASFRADSK